MSDTAERLYGCGSIDAAFTSDHRVVPWPGAHRTRRAPLVEPEALTALLSSPPHLDSVDPRHLHATQTWVLAHHTHHYLSGIWERTGTTSADRGKALNRFPVVHVDERGRHIIVTGHHRAMAALIEGRPLQARITRTGETATAVLPHLLVGAESALVEVVTGDPAVAAEAVTAGHSTLVPHADIARAALLQLELDQLLIDDRLSMATTGRCLADV